MPVQVRVDPTPNPHSLKLTLSHTVAAKPVTYANSAAAEADPLAKKLLAVPGVRSVFMLGNFITVTKDAAVEWDALTPKLKEALESHFA
ncbi:MAG: NifU N-terminal domain-containing protein [Planctomycetes bacterium]|nr:NifU N-terminal domain-containing protein [Planctomycetota bacterium]